MSTEHRRSPALAGLLSALVPGLGQVYNRQWGKGVAFLAGVVALMLELSHLADQAQLDRAAAGAPLENTGLIIGLLLLFLALVIWSIADAARTARRS
jgi:TM2 domain-containing membrane protein YozV